MRVRVFLFIELRMMSASIRRLLGESGRALVVGESRDPGDSLEALRAARPDVVVLDGDRPEELDPGLLAAIKRVCPGVRILTLAFQLGERLLEIALARGVDGCVHKDSEPWELLLGLEAVHRGTPYVSLASYAPA